MANPYEWSDDSDERARRAAHRHLEQERMQPPRRRVDDRDARRYGEDAAFYKRFDEPHAYDRREERIHARPEDDHRVHREHRSFEEEARHAGRSVARGWRRLTEGAHHLFEEDRGPIEHDPRRGGGMFGGDDRRGSLFSHDDGLGPRGRPGVHRGKGPAGYVRGDERILEEVCDRLADDGRLDASGIEVRIDAGEVTLSGLVRAREDKRRAEDIAESVSSVKHLQNNLRVKPPEQPAQPAAQAAPRPSARPAAQAAPKSAIQAPAPTSAQITDQRAAASKSATPRTRPARPN